MTESRIAVEFPYSDYASVTPAGDSVLAIAASPVLPPAVVRLDLSSGRHEVLRASRQVALDGGDISVPRHVEFPTAGGATAPTLCSTNRGTPASAAPLARLRR